MAISIIQFPVPQVLVDSKGDMFVATADNTVGKLTVGSNNTTLIADSTQTGGVKWAASSTSTLSAKGDILTASAPNTLAAVSVGANGTVLTADSNEANGVKWAATSGGFNPFLLMG